MNKNWDLFLRPTKNNLIMHIDMNSYFASCEQQANPAWRGRPLGVCSYLHPKGTILAASKEAKLLGIKTGTKLDEALRLCPNIILVRDDPTKYRIINDKINNIFSNYSDKIEHYSIDESFLFFGGQEEGCLQKIALRIKNRIRNEVGEWLTCNVGIAPTKFLAKVASDFNKPDGLTIINMENIDHMLSGLALTDIWGISFALEKHLNRIGIFTPLQLKYAKASLLMNKLGKNGYFLWSRMNGLEIDKIKVQEETKQKSIGHSYTLLQKTADKQQLLRIMMKLCEKTGRRLRKKSKMTQVIFVGWTYTYGGGWFRQEKLTSPIFDSWELFKNCAKHLEKKILNDRISKMFVSVGDLHDMNDLQLSLFEDKIGQWRLTNALDQINDKYGEMTIMRGNWKKWSEEISDRVAFRNAGH